MRWISIVFCFFVIQSAFSITFPLERESFQEAVGGKAIDPRIAKVYKVMECPIIDGIVTGDKIWENIPFQEGDFLKARVNSPALRQTKFKLAYDNENIYIATVCYEPDIKKLNDILADSKTLFWAKDNVEIFIGNSVYNQYAVAPNSERWASVTSAWGVNSCIGGDFWSFEAAVPLSVFNKTDKNSKWLINIVRNCYTVFPSEWSTWSPLKKVNHEPESFSEMHFLKKH